MKRILRIFFTLILICNICYAEENDILKSQKQSLGISSFISTAKKYTDDTFEDIDISELFENAVIGRVDNNNILKKIINKIGKETKTAINNIGIIIIIIIINSILVAISENLGNKSVSQVAYFVEYIIIVTLVLNNFAGIINTTKESILNLIGFSNSLIPILITLMLTTGAIVSAGIIKPILLLLINFIGNFIIDFILPLTIIGTTLGIVSKISNKVKIDKLAKFMKTSRSMDIRSNYDIVCYCFIIRR